MRKETVLPSETSALFHMSWAVSSRFKSSRVIGLDPKNDMEHSLSFGSCFFSACPNTKKEIELFAAYFGGAAASICSRLASISVFPCQGKAIDGLARTGPTPGRLLKARIPMRRRREQPKEVLREAGPAGPGNQVREVGVQQDLNYSDC
ncbi:hypothetical protein NL676_020195 [Syzygium grande]|nr:hypothetical protein NL676_020195 [Syzygium grande]